MHTHPQHDACTALYQLLIWVDAGKHGLLVKEHRLEKGDLNTNVVRHLALLEGVAGDTPANRKISRWMGHGGYLGCGYCCLRGVREDDKGNKLSSMCFTGYAKKTGWGWGGKEPEGRCKAGHQACQLSHEQQLERAKFMEQAILEGDRSVSATYVGCKGLSQLIEMLGYIDYNNAFPVPIAHAGPYGVVKQFCRDILMAQGETWSLTPDNLKIIRGRAGHIVDTLDFGRKYECVLDKSGQWVMETWLHFLETWSVYIFSHHKGKPVLSPVLSDMWDSLRRGLLYYLRLNPPGGVPENRGDATKLLKRYGELLETHVGARFCTYNLHMLVCRLARQDAARGKVAYGTEYWIELCVQQAKGIIDGRVTSFPEITLVKDLLLARGLRKLRATGGIWTWEEKCGTSALPMLASNIDVVDCGCQLLGSGREPTAIEHEAASEGMRKLFHHCETELEDMCWSVDKVAESDVLAYDYADTGEVDCGILHSTSYMRAKVKESYRIRVSYVEESAGGVIHYVAEVKFFVKLMSRVPGPASQLRVAIAKLLQVQKSLTASGHLWEHDRRRHKVVQNFAVLFDHMQAKVVCAKSTAAPASTWFIPYSNMSGR